MRRRRILVGCLIAVGLSLGTLELVRALSVPAAADTDEQGSATPTVVRVEVGALKRMTLHRYVTGYGVVAPAPATAGHPAAAASVAAPVSGVVTRVHVAAGQQVRRGQLLVELNSDSMTEAYAAREVARQRRLYAEHNTSLKALQSAEAQLALLRVTAPLSGTVVSVNVKAGEAVGTTSSVAEIMDLHRLVVRTDIPEDQAAELEVGQPVRVLGAAPLDSRLSYVSPTVDPKDGAVMAWVALPAPSGLRVGQYVALRITTATREDQLVAPSASVVTDTSGHSSIWIVRGSEAVRTPVRTGLREGGWVAVTAPGLSVGEQVVTVGAYGLPARTRIEVESATAGGSTGTAAAPATP